MSSVKLWRGVSRIALTVLAMLAVVLMATPNATATAATPAAASSGTHYSGHFTFTKNKSHPDDSKLTWSWTKYDSKGHKTGSGQKSWRTGSGQPPGITDSCKSNHGWLPNGWYDGLEHSKYWSSVIPTINWELTDKACPSGHMRTALFIHSKTPAAWKASSHPYYSNGCVHLSPTDIKDADSYSRSHGGPGYGTHRFNHLLLVTGG